MATTLYNALQEASITAKTYNGSVKLNIFHKIVSEDSRRELEEIEKRELKGLKKRIIETHADKHQSVANVVDGSATFYSYGEPITEQSRKVEEAYRDRNFGFVRKGNFLGRDAKDPDEVQEAVQYLRREEIINPNKFFRSKLILPRNVRKVAGKLNGLLGVGSDGDDFKMGRYLGTLFATGAVGVGIGYPQYGLGGAIGGFLGGYFLAGAGLLLSLGLENATLDRISKQRKSFEDALNTLDSEVRVHFPLDRE